MYAEYQKIESLSIAYAAADKPEKRADIEEKLVISYTPIIRNIVRRMGLPNFIEREDLVIAGLFGLLDSIRRYKPKEYKFEAFAAPKIKGAITDELRIQDWMPRTMRYKCKRARRVLESSDKVEYASDEEKVAEKLGISQEKARESIKLNHIKIISLDKLMNRDEMGFRYRDRNALRDSCPAAAQAAEKKEMCDKLTEMVERLDSDEREVMMLYYYEHLEMKEIGRKMGISDSRVCQIHRKTLAKLAIRMRKSI